MTEVAVAIQGEAGSFSHAAALQALGPAIRLVPCPSFEELFRAVERGDAARGAVPIENSLAGSVHENYDLLGAHALHVVAETQVRVRHCLIARPGTERAAIRRVASHPVALAQCRRFFAEHPEVMPVPAYDTAGSVRDLMAGRPAADARLAADAAIASSLAAQLYGATVLQEGLEDHAENYTRFLVVARDPAPPELARKTSLVFTLPNVPGSLHRALGVFAARGVDLTKIESRPLPGRPWEYAFYLDVAGGPRGGGARAEAALRTAGVMPQTFGTITVSDGISMGTEGMKYSLVSREVIADSIETACNAQSMDGLLVVGGCDKNMPGAMIAIARMDIPAVFVYGGTIKPGHHAGRDLTVVSVFEAVGEYSAGRIDAAELLEVERRACPGAGSCGGVFTADTMSSIFRGIGVSLPYSSPVAARDGR